MSPPRKIGQYQVGERLATGGAGEVYAGVDTKVGREVAIKFLRPELASDPDWVDRFLAEAKSLGRLNHPNIATLYALPQEDDHVCMIMELVRGRTLEQIIEDRRGPLGLRESLAILAQVADGISYAHERGVIHRDIKPSNLMVTESGRVKIMDFGIARVRGSNRLTRAGTAVGTALYMSPEQFDGFEGDERSDIYSLAIVLYELLAGAPPFKGTNEFELSRAHRGMQPPPLIPRIAGVEPRLESAIMTALAKRPEQRFPSMRSFSDATGATALRGDATGIVKNQTCLAQGQATAHEPSKHAPLHTVVIALMRSRAAAIGRRLKRLHPAVQGVSVGVLAMAIVAAVFLREPNPTTSDPKPGPSESLSGDQDGKQRQIPATPTPAHNDPISPPPNKVQVSSAPDYELSKTPCNQSFIGNEKGKFSVGVGNCDNDPTKARALPAVTEDHPPQIEASKHQEGNKPTSDAADDLVRAYDEGLHYLHGDSGFPKDEEKANELIYRAADKGYPPAMTKLGEMYYYKKNFRAARKWFERAAKDGKGEGEAMFNLGSMYQDGLGGLTKSLREAKSWYQMASNAGYLPAKQRLEELDN
jgi:eukaryotic-like serine/threonine-protein kinase